MMAFLRVFGSLLCLSCIVLKAEGSTHFYLNIHKEVLSGVDADDTDNLVLINIGASTATVSYTNFRSAGWFRDTFSLNALQFNTLSLETKLLISYQPNAEQLVMEFSSDISSIKIISYNRVIPQTALDAFVPLPTEYGSLEYYVISFQPPGGFVRVSVMPVGADATVTYTMPPTNAVDIQTANGVFSAPVTFAASHVVTTTVNFQEAQLFDSSSNLSGMKITSDQPIHVLVSSSSVNASIPNGDFTQNQMVPIQYWGRSHVVAVQNVYSDRILILSASSSTTVNLAAETPTQYCYFFTTGAPGTYIDFIAQDSSYYISTSEPVAVAHLIVTTSQSYTMYMVTPVEQFVTLTYIFIPSDPFSTFTNTITIYTNTSSTANVRLNGVAISGTWTEIPGSGLSYTSETVQTNAVQTVSTSNDGVIGGFVHGNGPSESYSYPLSSDCRNIVTGCGGSTCYATNTFDFSTCPPAPTTTVAPITTTTVAPTMTTTVAPTMTTTVASPTTTAVTTTTTTTTVTGWNTTTPALFQAVALSFFCSDIETRLYIGSEFLGPIGLNITKLYIPPCPCNCTPIVDANATIKVQQGLAELKASLTVDVQDTRAYIRTKTCAKDTRPSAVAIGSLFAIAMISGMAFVVIIDMRKLLLDGQHFRRLIQDEYRNKCGDRPVDDEPPIADEDVFGLDELPNLPKVET